MSINKKLAALGVVGALSLSVTALIIPSEGEVLGVYLDPARILTSCYGHTGPELKMGQKFTQEQCLEQLVVDLHKHDRQLRSAVKVPLSEGEHAAYLSFIYNVGYGRKDGVSRGRDGFAVLRNGKPSTMLSLLNSGQRHKACDQLLAWIKIDGKESAGLRTRRAKERKVCLKDLTS